MNVSSDELGVAYPALISWRTQNTSKSALPVQNGYRHSKTRTNGHLRGNMGTEYPLKAAFTFKFNMIAKEMRVYFRPFYGPS